MRVLVRNLNMTQGRDWLGKDMDRADRTTQVCYVMAERVI